MFGWTLEQKAQAMKQGALPLESKLSRAHLGEVVMSGKDTISGKLH